MILSIDGSRFSTLSGFYAYMNSEFFHASYFGENLDALADCLSDIEPSTFIWENSEKSRKEIAEFEVICEIIRLSHELELR